MSKVWDNGPQKQAARFVLLCLADFANDAGECWPSVEAIAAKTCLSERGVRENIRWLEAEGWLSTVVGGGAHACNQYRLNPAPYAEKTRQQVPGKPGSRFRPAPRAEKTRQITAQNPAPGAPEPLRTIIREEEPPLVPPKGKLPPKARLPDDWALNDAGWAYARSQNIPDEAITDEARGFHAYWTDRRDRDASKSARGWEACWENWCRRIAPRYRSLARSTGPGGYGSGGSIASIAARRRAAGAV